MPQLKAAWDEAGAAHEQAVAERDLAIIEFERTAEAPRAYDTSIVTFSILPLNSLSPSL